VPLIAAATPNCPRPPKGGEGENGRRGAMIRIARWSSMAVGALLLLTAGGLLLDRLFPPDLSRLSDLSVLVEDKDGGLLRAFTAKDGNWRLPVTTEAVDPRFRRMLLAYEDKRFETHWGVDPLALMRALGQLATHGHVVSGASTLTMQTARLLEPRPRTLGAKLMEMARAFQLEERFGKDRILAMYLTLAPYGGNLSGIRAAARFYFGKEPRELSDGEAALLVALPQSPERLRPDRAPAAASAARARVLARLQTAGVLDALAASEAAAAPVPAGRLRAALDAPHLAERLVAAAPGQSEILSLLDGDLQRRLQALAARLRLGLEAGATLAILVAENSTMAVRAYVGAADYFDAASRSQNDMVRAIRSPGSTLKPFVYGLAFDDLLIHPETIVDDRPMRFGDYAPQNFDHRFHGELTAREALQLSLNLPAVALLDRVGPPRFANLFRDVGLPLHLPDPGQAPGLPIVLGGVGTSLEDLVTLYAGVAAGGGVRALRFTAEDKLAEPRKLMSPVAAWYLTRILGDTPPPPSWLAGANRARAPLVAYKTGTSYGFRDAWAIGYTADYTVGVWVGRPDGSFSSGRMGREAAAPVLFAVFDQLPMRQQSLPPPPEGALLATNAELPAALHRFDARPVLLRLAAPGAKGGPEIAFPVDGSTIALTHQGQAPKSLPLDADGGALPLLWLVNGKRIDSTPFRRAAEWRPDGPGQVRITVIDGAGRVASSEVWVQ
jgi:penicillin-binding protein 1C